MVLCKELTETKLYLVNKRIYEKMHTRAKTKKKTNFFYNAVMRQRSADQKEKQRAKNLRRPSPSKPNLLLQDVMQINVPLSHHALFLIPTTAFPDNFLAQTP